MTRREKYDLLNSKRSQEIIDIYDKYKAEFDEILNFKFDINDIVKDGWHRSYQYFARGLKNEYEYNKNNKTIYISFYDDGSIHQILPFNSFYGSILDMDDLKNYETL